MNNQFEILVLSGIPCSGKSTFRNNPIYKDHVVICRDDVREKYWGRNYSYTDQNETKVSTICENTFDFAVGEKKNIIIDNTHCKEQYLKLWIEARPSNYMLKIYFFEVPLWLAYIRNVGRWLKCGKWIPFFIIKNMKKNYDKIDKKKYEHVFY